MFSLTSWFHQWCNLKIRSSKRMDSSALSVANQLVFQSKLANLDHRKEEIFPVWECEIPNLEDLHIMGKPNWLTPNWEFHIITPTWCKKFPICDLPNLEYWNSQSWLTQTNNMKQSVVQWLLWVNHDHASHYPSWNLSGDPGPDSARVVEANIPFDDPFLDWLADGILQSKQAKNRRSRLLSSAKT